MKMVEREIEAPQAGKLAPNVTKLERARRVKLNLRWSRGGMKAVAQLQSAELQTTQT